MSHEQLAAIEAYDPVAGIILSARGAKRPNAMVFYPGPFTGSRKNLDEATGAITSAYRFYGSVVTASKDELVVDVAFQDTLRTDVPYSPAPPPIRITAGSSGSSTVLPLSAEQHAALDKAFAALGNPHKIRQASPVRQ